jgi:hypothetical protein
MIRSLRSWLAAAALAAPLSACCSDCIKDPPCRCNESPCCLSPLQRTALEKKTHALPVPVAYVYEDKTFLLFTEKGQKEFDKDPAKFAETGAVRLIRGGQTWRCDIDPGADYDLAGTASGLTPTVR